MGQSVIEINGTRYDASTGRVITDAPAPSKPAHKSSGHNIDGIVSSSQPKPAQTTTLANRPTSNAAPKQVVRDINMVKTRSTTKSKTLMRSVVKKPFTASQVHQPISGITPSSSYAATSSHGTRLKHAVSTPTHTQVSRFAYPTQQKTKLTPKVVSHLPVSQQPYRSAPTAPTQPKPATVPHLSASEQFVGMQLAKHVASEEAPKQKKRLHKKLLGAVGGNKLRAVATSSLAILLLGGFLVYQNLPTISLALANREAGIAAKLPKGIPSNFAVEKVSGNSSGSVLMNYTSRVDDRKFSLAQVKADTTVKSLEETVARVSNNQYQTYQAGGITLFLSPNDRVDWIDGEMRYNITGSTGFSPDQIAQIATSL